MTKSLASSSRSRSTKPKKSSSKKQPKILIDENLNVEDEDNGVTGAGSRVGKKKSSRKADKKGKRSRAQDNSVSDDASSLLLDSSTLSKGAKKGKGRRSKKMQSELEETLKKIN